MASFVLSQLFASQPSTGGASRLVIVNHGLVSVAASYPAADQCDVDRRDPSDGALLLYGRYPVGACACRTVACAFANLDTAASHSPYPDSYRCANFHTRHYTHPYRDAETGSQRYFYGNHRTYPDLHSLCHSYTHCPRNGYQHPDTNQHAHSHADAVSHTDLDTDGYGNAQSNAEPYTYAEPDSERHAHAKSDTDPYARIERLATASVASWNREVGGQR